MATFAQIAQIVTNQPLEFQSRVNYAMCVAAINVYSEGTGVTGHAARAAFAVRVLSGNYNIAAVCFGVMTNPTIAGEAVYQQPANGNGVPDTDIQFAVNSIWNALAGA
jgi:hypothetical protein